MKGRGNMAFQPNNGLANGSSASTLSSKNQITVSSKVRKMIDAEPGGQIIFAVNENNEIVVKIKKKIHCFPFSAAWRQKKRLSRWNGKKSENKHGMSYPLLKIRR